jgi:hypothetical protein
VTLAKLVTLALATYKLQDVSENAYPEQGDGAYFSLNPSDWFPDSVRIEVTGGDGYMVARGNGFGDESHSGNDGSFELFNFSGNPVSFTFQSEDLYFTNDPSIFWIGVYSTSAFYVNFTSVAAPSPPKTVNLVAILVPIFVGLLVIAGVVVVILGVKLKRRKPVALPLDPDEPEVARKLSVLPDYSIPVLNDIIIQDAIGAGNHPTINSDTEQETLELFSKGCGHLPLLHWYSSMFSFSQQIRKNCSKKIWT